MTSREGYSLFRDNNIYRLKIFSKQFYKWGWRYEWNLMYIDTMRDIKYFLICSLIGCKARNFKHDEYSLCTRCVKEVK